MNLIFEWLLFYASIMFCMSIDNIFWIPTSPEYKKFKKHDLINPNMDDPIIVENEEYHSKLDYILRYRIWSVLTHWRDIIPAIITSGVLTLIW